MSKPLTADEIIENIVDSTSAYIRGEPVALNVKKAEAKAQIEAMIATEKPDGDWWVTSHNDDGTVTSVSGSYSTDSDASKCRYELERREAHHNYWIERATNLTLKEGK